MAVKFIALMLLASAALVAASCPSQCSGHGTCGANDRCTCYSQTGTAWGSRMGWTGADCSQRTCPLATAWDQISTQSNRLFPTLFEGASTSTNLLVAYKDATFNEAEDKQLLVKISTVTDNGAGNADTVKFRWKYSTDDDYSTEVDMEDSQFKAYQIGTGPSGTGSGIRIFFDSSKIDSSTCGFEDFEAHEWTIEATGFGDSSRDDITIEDELDNAVIQLKKSSSNADSDNTYNIKFDYVPAEYNNYALDDPTDDNDAATQVEVVDIGTAAQVDGKWLYFANSEGVKCGMWFNTYSVDGVVVDANRIAEDELLALDSDPTEVKIQTGEQANDVADRVSRALEGCTGIDLTYTGPERASNTVVVDSSAQASDFFTKTFKFDIGAYKATITNAAKNPVADFTTDITSGLTYSIDTQGLDDDGGFEVTTLYISTHDPDGDLDGKWFTLNDGAAEFSFWFDVDDDATPEPAGLTGTVTEITGVLSSHNPEEIALVIETAVEAVAAVAISTPALATSCWDFDTGAAGFSASCAEDINEVITSVTEGQTAAQIASALFDEYRARAFTELSSDGLTVTWYSLDDNSGHTAPVDTVDNVVTSEVDEGVAFTTASAAANTGEIEFTSAVSADYEGGFIRLTDASGDVAVLWLTAAAAAIPAGVGSYDYSASVDVSGDDRDAIEDAFRTALNAIGAGFTITAAEDGTDNWKSDLTDAANGLGRDPAFSQEILTMTNPVAYVDGTQGASFGAQITVTHTNTLSRQPRVRSSAINTRITTRGVAASGSLSPADGDNFYGLMSIYAMESASAIATRLEGVVEGLDTWATANVVVSGDKLVITDDSVSEIAFTPGGATTTLIPSANVQKYLSVETTNAGGGYREETQITFLNDGDNIAELRGKHIVMHDDSIGNAATVYFWFSVDGLPASLAAPDDAAAAAAEEAVEVAISEDDSAETVATALYDAAVARLHTGVSVAADATSRAQEWVVTRSGATVTISNTEAESSLDAQTDIAAADATVSTDRSVADTAGTKEKFTIYINPTHDVSDWDDAAFFAWGAAGSLIAVAADADGGGANSDVNGAAVTTFLPDASDSAEQTAEKIRAAAATACGANCVVSLEGSTVTVEMAAVGHEVSVYWDSESLSNGGTFGSADGTVTLVTQGVDAVSSPTQTCGKEHWADHVAVNDLWTVTAEHNDGVDYTLDDGNTAHQKLECAGRGMCDRKTGQCECFTGYTGEACARTACPSDCNGHGICQDLRRFAADAGNDYDGAWDSYAHMGCLCDGGYRGPDCSLIECPSGADPLGADGGSAGRDCSGRGVCDYTTGQCGCFKGFFGERCESQTNYI